MPPGTPGTWRVEAWIRLLAAVTAPAVPTTAAPGAAIAAAGGRAAAHLLVNHLLSSLYGLGRALDDYIFLPRALWSVLVHLAVSAAVPADGGDGLAALAHDEPHLVAGDRDGVRDVVPAAAATVVVAATAATASTSVSSHLLLLFRNNLVHPHSSKLHFV